ncbi:MAG: Nif3-like dinuclear metal center hexameric protein [Akkermansiaceae bacterium]
MANLVELTSFLDRELNIQEIPDYPQALNGLQMQNAGEVKKVAAAVDASLPVFEKAIASGADLLLVHHGMFWQGAQKVTGAVYQKLKIAMDAGMAVYSAHIPLDVHPVWGNNIQLAGKIGMTSSEPFFDWKGIKLGVCQELEMSRDELILRVSSAVGGSVHLCPGGSDAAGKVGVITGGAGSEVAAMAACGIDTFISGEGPHWSYPLAEELGINVLYAGHYATETFGVRALAGELSQRFGVNAEFIDHPTGL